MVFFGCGAVGTSFGFGSASFVLGATSFGFEATVFVFFEATGTAV